MCMLFWSCMHYTSDRVEAYDCHQFDNCYVLSHFAELSHTYILNIAYMYVEQ